MAYRYMGIRLKSILSISSRNTSSKSHFIKNIGPGGFFLLSVPVATFCLGTWQVKRRTWKLNLIESVKKRREIEPVDLPDEMEKLSEMEYRRVHVRGEFDHSKELYLGPRQLIATADGKSGGIFSSRSQSGVLVITPFYVPDKNITILVNRGWVPRNKMDPSTKKRRTGVTGEIDLVGTVRLPEKRPQFSPKHQPNSDFFFYRDVPKMTEITGAAPIFLDAETTVPGGPIGGQTRITFRNEHLSYIITWYSLCAATTYMWYRKYLHPIKLAV
ncbi:surfeit locus protein 1-like [Stegodyphus dumicola]|uniref:surfeit locus protein 1-like n=1 Tax=Stegodyphus dumicola TaxID=202533 RepID=UPI0015B1B188|nr:surfeit locus protein 1-like [Stegodyphus dumicola]